MSRKQPRRSTCAVPLVGPLGRRCQTVFAERDVTWTALDAQDGRGKGGNSNKSYLVQPQKAVVDEIQSKRS